MRWKEGLALLGAAVGTIAPRALAYGDHNNYPYAVHPGFTVSEVDMPKVSTMGIDWLSTGQMVLITCQTADNYAGGSVPNPNAASGVWLVSDPAGAHPSVQQIASMFRQPTGGAVVNDVIYVSDRDGFYKIKSLHPSDIAANRALAIQWPNETPPKNFSNGNWNNGWWHQWVFCPFYQGGKFHAVYSGTIKIGGASENPPSTSYSGAFLSWNPDGAGGLEKTAGGFRSPNGAAGGGGMMMVADNQGSWEPSCPLDLIKPGRFYGHRQNKGYAPNWAQAANDAGTMPYEPPVAWLLDGDAPAGGGPGQSASQPLYLDRGPFAGDWIIGDNNSKGISRVTLDPVDGNDKYNGSATFFTNGFGAAGSEAGINRLSWHPDQEIIYVGTLGTLGNWPTSMAMPFYAVRFDHDAVAATFEIRAVRSRKGGVEVELSQPVDASSARPASFSLNQYQLKRQDGYGAGNDEIAAPAVSAVRLSTDRKRVFLEIGDAAAVDRVLKITAAGLRSSGAPLFFNQTVFTHNWQSSQPFQADASAIAPRRSDPFLENHVTCRLQGGSLSIEVDLRGDYSVELRSARGALLEDRAGRGPGRFAFAGRRGLCVLRVSQGERAFLKPVFL